MYKGVGGREGGGEGGGGRAEGALLKQSCYFNRLMLVI